jgi:diguanylate cyclase (GGDEF)-like protein
LLPGPLAAQVLVFAFLMLMAGGHAASYAAHSLTVSLGVLALAVPITVVFAFQGDAFHRAMAFASAMYLAAVFRSIRTLGYFFARSHRLAHDVQVERDRAERLARTDFLTGLNNRRAFYEMSEACLRQAKRYEREASIIMLDIDHFKAINDQFGHATGDAVIRSVAQAIRDNVRAADVAGRLGGEEFAILLPETVAKDALSSAERLRAAVGSLRVQHSGYSVGFTASFGVAGMRPGDQLDELIARADSALYRAKNGGRNRVAPDTAS